MIVTPQNELVEGYEFRYKVIEVVGYTPEIELPSGGRLPEHVFKGADTREFRTLDGAKKYADKLMRRGRGWPVVIQTGKLLWLTAAGTQAEAESAKGVQFDG